MTLANKANTFDDFGYKFQCKLIGALMFKPDFLNQINDVITPEYFDNPAFSLLIEKTLDYFKEYKSVPTMEFIAVKIKEIENEPLKESAKECVKDALREKNALDIEWVMDQALLFCKNQAMKKAIFESVELVKYARYDEVKNIIDQAMKAGGDRNLGHMYMEALKERVSNVVRDTVETGWNIIDEIMDGGLGAGELGVLVSNAGGGKSWGLVSLGAAAVKNGLNVIHYTLELNEQYTGLRYDSKFSGIPSQNIKYRADDVEKVLQKLSGKLIIKYYPTKTASVNTLKAHIDKCIVQGFKPDLVIVDYGDLLKGSGHRNAEKREILENIYEDLRGLAGEYKLPVWTASQSNRSSIEMDIIGADKIAEAYSKIMIADFVVSISRKISDKIAGTSRWHIIKNRFGPDGQTYNSKMNTANGNIAIHDESTSDGKQLSQEMADESEVIRKMLSKKHHDNKTNGENEPDDLEGFE